MPPVPEKDRSRGGVPTMRERLEFAAARVLLGSLRLLPYRLSIALAEWVGLLVGSSVSKWRHVAEKNIQRALPELDQTDRKRIRRGVYRNLGRVVFALAKLPTWSPAQIAEHVDFVGLEHFRAAEAKGRGVLLLTAHLGNWELGALAHGAVVGPLRVMVRPIKNHLVDQLVESLRSSHGNGVIAKRRAARQVLRVLARNGTVGVLADQNTLAEEAVFIRFFGMTASANRGFAQLALRSGAAVVPAIARWDVRSNRHVVEYGPEIALLRTSRPAQDVEANSQRFQSVLEDRIREHPDQWLWIHRRWKTQPLRN